MTRQQYDRLTRLVGDARRVAEDRAGADVVVDWLREAEALLMLVAPPVVVDHYYSNGAATEDAGFVYPW